MFVYYIISYSAVTYDDYEYPGWAEGMGLCISFSSMIWVPAYFVYYLVTGPGTVRYMRGCQMAKFDFHPLLGLRQGGGRGGAIQGEEGIKFCNIAIVL